MRGWLRQNANLHHQSGDAARFDDLCPLQESLAGGTFLQVDQTASAHQAILWHLGERGEDPDLDRSVGLRAGRHRQEATPAGGVALHIAAGPFGHSIRENADPVCAFVDARPIR